jgi:hypothetical protein
MIKRVKFITARLIRETFHTNVWRPLEIGASPTFWVPTSLGGLWVGSLTFGIIDIICRPYDWGIRWSITLCDDIALGRSRGFITSGNISPNPASGSIMINIYARIRFRHIYTTQRMYRVNLTWDQMHLPTFYGFQQPPPISFMYWSLMTPGAKRAPFRGGGESGRGWKNFFPDIQKIWSKNVFRTNSC